MTSGIVFLNPYYTGPATPKSNAIAREASALHGNGARLVNVLDICRDKARSNGEPIPANIKYNAIRTADSPAGTVAFIIGIRTETVEGRPGASGIRVEYSRDERHAQEMLSIIGAAIGEKSPGMEIAKVGTFKELGRKLNSIYDQEAATGTITPTEKMDIYHKVHYAIWDYRDKRIEERLTSMIRAAIETVVGNRLDGRMQEILDTARPYGLSSSLFVKRRGREIYVPSATICIGEGTESSWIVKAIHDFASRLDGQN